MTIIFNGYRWLAGISVTETGGTKIALIKRNKTKLRPIVKVAKKKLLFPSILAMPE